MRCYRSVTFALLAILALGAQRSGGADKTARKRESRLSCSVALVWKGPEIESFLKTPGLSFIQAYARFDQNLPDDVIFGIDQEFLDGVSQPLYLQGGDWMALVGLQRTGAIWVATGTDATMAGKPSKERTWKILDLGQKLKADTWYRLRIEADFASRQYRKFTIEGAGLTRSFDLAGLKLDYPNHMPFSGRAMTFYSFAMRGRGLMKPGAEPNGPPIVYFDDVTAGPVSSDGSDTELFQSSFEEQAPIGKQPVTVPVIQLGKYEQGRWYLERDEALFNARAVPFAHTGQHVGVADARID